MKALRAYTDGFGYPEISKSRDRRQKRIKLKKPKAKGKSEN